jgi:hypothetical protein
MNVTRNLTVSNRIDEALAVRAEIQTLSGSAESPITVPTVAAPNPHMSLGWHRGQVEQALILTTNGQRTPFPLRHDGEIRVSPRGWECRVGRSLVPDLGPALVKAFQSTNELTLGQNEDSRALRLRNEVGNERPWQGVLHRFELHNRVLEPDAARRLSNTP